MNSSGTVNTPNEVLIQEALEALRGGDTARSLELVEQALTFPDFPPNGFLLKGLLYALNGKSAESVRAFQSELIIYPQNPAVGENLKALFGDDFASSLRTLTSFKESEGFLAVEIINKALNHFEQGARELAVQTISQLGHPFNQVPGLEQALLHFLPPSDQKGDSD